MATRFLVERVPNMPFSALRDFREAINKDNPQYALNEAVTRHFFKKETDEHPKFEERFSEEDRKHIKAALDKRALQLWEQYIKDNAKFFNHKTLYEISESNEPPKDIFESLSEDIRQLAPNDLDTAIKTITLPAVKKLATKAYNALPTTNVVIPAYFKDHSWQETKGRATSSGDHELRVQQGDAEGKIATAYALDNNQKITLTPPGSPHSLQATPDAIICTSVPKSNKELQIFAHQTALLIMVNVKNNSNPIVISGNNGQFAHLVKLALKDLQKNLTEDDFRKSLKIENKAPRIGITERTYTRQKAKDAAKAVRDALVALKAQDATLDKVDKNSKESETSIPRRR